MANKLYEEEDIRAIAGAIRENAPETAGDSTFTVAEMPAGVGAVYDEGYNDGLLAGGSSEAIIDVNELPTENINEDVFYRVMTGTFWVGTLQYPWTCHIVEELPSEGENCTSDFENFTFYYSTADGSVSGYADETLAASLEIPSGWYPVEDVMSFLGATWGGIIYNENDIPSDNSTVSLLLTYSLHYYKDGWNEVGGGDDIERVGRFGTGLGAEIFNKPANEAEGDYSHAEGSNTGAYGYASHTEGEDTNASGEASHAEGRGAYASGYASHAEGGDTAAIGDYSHSEGQNTIASGDHQHVQGKHNIEDKEGKYAHIVGNGAPAAHSNAHTLDWGGSAWFAGSVKVGGTGQDDENAKTLATEKYVDDLVGDISTALDELHTYAQNIING